MSLYRKLFLVACLMVCGLTNFPKQVHAQTSQLAVVAAARPYFTEPALSPDRKEIAFVSGGDIWTVPATGGVASLLISHSANEARPLYSPDGRQLAFISNRTGNGDIYLLPRASYRTSSATHCRGVLMERIFFLIRVSALRVFNWPESI